MSVGGTKRKFGTSHDTSAKGGKRTSARAALMSQNDPKRTRRAGSKSFGQGRLP
jgi:hypothetical protein